MLGVGLRVPVEYAHDLGGEHAVLVEHALHTRVVALARLQGSQVVVPPRCEADRSAPVVVFLGEPNDVEPPAARRGRAGQH